jgi:S1-C subfamily serine protease
VKAESAKITVKAGLQFSARLVGRDPATDIAVLQIQGASNLTAIAFGDSDKLEVGDFVIAVSRCLRRPVEIFNAYSRPPASSHVNARGICGIK